MAFLTDDILEQFVGATNAYSEFMKAYKQASLAATTVPPSALS